MSMTVGELRVLLRQYPDDMEILNGRYSDYVLVEKDELYTVWGVPHERDGWVMRSHPSMSEENKAAEKKYLYLEGD